MKFQIVIDSHKCKGTTADVIMDLLTTDQHWLDDTAVISIAQLVPFGDEKSKYERCRVETDKNAQ